MNDIEMVDKDGNIRGALVGFKHTGGPWHFIEGITCLSIQGDRAETILLDTSPEKNREQKIADYQRIVACVNACEGVSQVTFDGGWTSLGMSQYANQLEGRLAEITVSQDGVPYLFTAGWDAGFQEAMMPDSKPDQDRCTAAYLQMVGSGMIQK